MERREGDRARWDEKYRGSLGRESRPPDPFVVACLDELDGPGLAGARRALDLAAGAGRHALELARRGYRVAAWDVSPVGLELLRRAASGSGFALETRAVDLLDPELELAPDYDLVCVVDFLDRPFWNRISGLVRPGGHVIARTFTRDWPGPKPPAPYRLAPGELGAGLPGLETLRTEEAAGRAGLLARRRQ